MPYKDKADQAAAAKKHYEANKAVIIERSKKKNGERREMFKRVTAEYLSTHHCVDCGESDPIVLDFDHVRGEKRCNIAEAGRVLSSLSDLEEEIAKCEIRCANCHRRVTYSRRHRVAGARFELAT